MEDITITHNNSKYVCVMCEFNSGNKNDYSRHLLTAKHLLKCEKGIEDHENDLILTQKTQPIEDTKCSCGKEYKHYSGLWRHKKKCTILNQAAEAESAKKAEIALKITELENAIPNIDMNLIFAFMKDTQEFKQLVLEQSKIIADLVGKVGNTTNNINNTQNNQNNQNNQFNLQFFLNDTCKGAMNVKDFLNFINVDLEDIEYIGTHGYVAGISRIFTKNLARLGKYEKPIWVTDEKRETIMYKEDDEWKKDDDHIKMNKISVAIEFKCIKALVLWRELNPDWREDEKKGEFLNIMNGCVFGGELKTKTIFYHPPDKDQKAKIVRNMIQHLKIPKALHMKSKQSLQV
jgi:hypothetical protein